MKRYNTGCGVSLENKLIASELAEDVETLNIINLGVARYWQPCLEELPHETQQRGNYEYN